MTPVRPEPAALQSRVKHSTTEPLRSLCQFNVTVVPINAKHHCVENSLDPDQTQRFLVPNIRKEYKQSDLISIYN